MSEISTSLISPGEARIAVSFAIWDKIIDKVFQVLRLHVSKRTPFSGRFPDPSGQRPFLPFLPFTSPDVALLLFLSDFAAVITSLLSLTILKSNVGDRRCLVVHREEIFDFLISSPLFPPLSYLCTIIVYFKE